MKISTIGTVLAAIVSSCTVVRANCSSIPPIKIDGNAFFNSKNGERFYIRGVDYQPGGSSKLQDPLANSDNCKRDVPVFKDLGINTIRVYSVDNSEDHSECMEQLQEAGIYLVLDVNTPQASLSRIDPKCSYNANYLQNIFATIDAFAKYDNVLGFFAGNEVINDVNNTFTAPYVKAVVRDMKKYMKAREYREIPVGYSAADISSNRELAAHYFNCGDDDDARIDMLGVNDYSWCGNSNFEKSGYSSKVDTYKNYSIPIFLSEFGCNQVSDGRPFTEIGAIYSDKMSPVFSGGLVYEYSGEANGYGLVDIDGNSVSKNKDYQNLKEEYAAHSNPSGDGGYSSSEKHSDCPSYKKDVWEVNSTIPEMPSAASAYFKKGAGTPQGTKASTQNDCGSDVHVVPAGGGDNSGSGKESNSTSAEVGNSSRSSSSSRSYRSSSASITTSFKGDSATKAKDNKSKGAGVALQVPFFFRAIAQITDLFF
ncbi:1,3-beta-glucanosyltransferase [Zygosaccharomyces mellis]|uniref:1,3-beta-glucanosyltransferase n=1 Tax=Zygosaccharomyces mellis TaxID=42258 RepID=A0A4C2E5E5_9SACH|nr:1,3-beta-glucanosyltransferase [Zygosaccharomyces mellis]